jgi:hypothetical protein
MKSRIAIPLTFAVVAFTVTITALVGIDAENGAAVASEKPAPVAVNEEKKSGDGFSPFVDKDGNISRPTDYKQKWAHLGSWAVAKKKDSSVIEMHDVYTPHETIVAFNKTGEFPDGTVLVKEVHKSKNARLTTGHAAWSSDMKVWFVMIKDKKGRFKDNDHWGEGWGWALFEAKDPTKNVSVDYESSCISCHTPVEESDWVYRYGYPDLKGPEKKWN